MRLAGRFSPALRLWAAIRYLSRTSKSLGKDIPEPTCLLMVQLQRVRKVFPKFNLVLVSLG